MPDTLDTVAPGFAFKGNVDMGIVSNAADAEHMPLHVREMREVNREGWRLVYPTLTPAERATLVGVFEAAMLGDGTTTFTPPGGSATTVRFVSNKLNFTRTTAAAEAVEIHIRELL